MRARETGHVLYVEGGFGMRARDHFTALCKMFPGLRGLVIYDHDGRPRQEARGAGLHELQWRRYEPENYFRRVGAATATPMLLRKGSLHELIKLCDPADLNGDVTEKLDALMALLGPGCAVP